MAGGIELAKAYVQIVPSAEGIQGKITEALGGESASAGQSAGQTLGKELVGALGKVISAAAIGKMITDAINAGGALQQSLGGIETLFKDSADTVKAYAAQAYKTAGLSANDYMEATTSFAASLLNSLGGDTAAAAEAANMAMVDMSDNANKMGTSMQDIQNAYQGFAKQNYTMLDNLKIGYGGTQAEMQRLLEDAEKISGVHYELGNLADMYNAIHVIQTELDITGTTAKEASTTLTGSFASMSAAFQNVLGNLALGEDLTPSLEALFSTAQTWLVGNLLPMLVDVLSGIPQIIYDLVPQILQSGTDLINSLAEGFEAGIPDFLDNALPQLLSFTENLRENAGQLVDAGLNMITQLVNGLIAGLPQLIAYVPDIVINIAGIINDNMPKILAQGVSLIVQLIAGIVKSIPLLIQNAGKIVQAVLSVISAFNWVNLGTSMLKNIASGVRSMGSSLLNAFKGGFGSALKWLWELPGKLFELAKNALQSFIDGLLGTGNVASAVTAGLDIAETASGTSDAAAAADEWTSVWTDANDTLAASASDTASICAGAYSAAGSAAASAAGSTAAAAQAAASVVNSLSDTTTRTADGITTTIQTVTEQLSDGTSQQKRVVTRAYQDMVDGVLKNIKVVETTAADGKTTVQTTMEDVAATVAHTVTSTSDAVLEGIQTTTKVVTETLTDGTEQQKRVITQTYSDIIDGALVTVERVRTIAADGTEQTADTIKAASADSFDGLISEWKTETNKGVLGTFDTLVTAVKKQDWQSVAQWTLTTLYNNLAPENKKLIEDFGLSLIRQANDVLAKGAGALAEGAWDIGSKIAGGITSGFGQILTQASGLGKSLTGIFSGLKAPLSAAATAISNGLSGGLLSAFPTIYASLGTLISSIGSAFVAMLQAIGTALLPTGVGTPQGIAMIAAGVALVATIAAIVASLGGVFKRPSTGSGSSGSSGGSSVSDTITGASGTLWDYEKTAPLPQRPQRPNIEVNQYIYSKAQTAADLMREAQYEQERAVLQGV